MIRKHNIEFSAGYSMGYQHIAFDNGDIYDVSKEILSRGVSLKTSWAAGFKKGAEDAYNKRPCKY